MLSVQLKQFFLLCLLVVALNACITVYAPVPPPACAVTREIPIPYRVVEVGISATTTYPKSFFQRAMKKIVQEITNAVVPNTGGMDVTISLIHANSFDPSSVIASITIPAIDADPSAPVFLPTPASSGDPFEAVDAQSTVEAKNGTLQSDYQCALYRNHQRLQEVKEAVKKKTDPLLTLDPQMDNITDIWGMVGRASKRFAAVQNEKKILILATDYEKVTWDTNFTRDIFLPDVSVRSIYAYSPNQVDYERNIGFWVQAFKTAGSPDVRVYDEVQSDNNRLSLFS